MIHKILDVEARKVGLKRYIYHCIKPKAESDIHFIKRIYLYCFWSERFYGRGNT